MEQDELQALLRQLRESQDGPPNPAQPAPAAQPPPSAASELDQILGELVPATKHVASEAGGDSVAAPTQAELSALLSSLQREGQPRQGDVTQLSFPESLPILQRLSTDQRFIRGLQLVRANQDRAEADLKSERDKLIKELNRTVGSPHMRASRLRDWDRKALARWTKLKSDQQKSLQNLGVPTFSVSKDPIILKRQERVVTVLTGFLDDAEES